MVRGYSTRYMFALARSVSADARLSKRANITSRSAVMRALQRCCHAMRRARCVRCVLRCYERPCDARERGRSEQERGEGIGRCRVLQPA